MQMEVRPDPAEVSRARRWARSRLAGSGMAVDEPLAETLVLLISELVTNAVVHTGCPAVLRMRFPAQCGAADEDAVGDADGGADGSTAGAGGEPTAGAVSDRGAGGAAGSAAQAGPDSAAWGERDAGGVQGARGAQSARGEHSAGVRAVPGSGVEVSAVETVRVEVMDASSCPPRPRCADGDDTHGRGLELVDGLADRWGWKSEGGGKSIWCEVDRQGAPPAHAAHPSQEPAGHAAEQVVGGAESAASEAVPAVSGAEPAAHGVERNADGGAAATGDASGAGGEPGPGVVSAGPSTTVVAVRRNAPLTGERDVPLAGACTSRRPVARRV
ncbi:hypothetical protein FHS42_006723 [Streptomyces zagrosensis]|uniref:Regulatory protein n=1 Tax=Streptomyces zagrosensis TaxID=1042984 RepID=A0A7W9QI27_9ACTN|nr:hypothetical protein [Streptomyces zagrosensis]